jgi:hypothetical protein
MIQVIDIRKHDAEKVIEYWTSKGGKDMGWGRSKLDPFVGIDPDDNIISGWTFSKNKDLIDLPTEPELIVGKEYTMRNGEKAVFLAAAPNNQNVFYHVDDKKVYVYNQLNWSKCKAEKTDFDIIIEPEKKEPRTIYVNEFDGTVEGSFAWLTEEDAKAAVSPRHKNPRTIKFVELIED